MYDAAGAGSASADVGSIRRMEGMGGWRERDEEGSRGNAVWTNVFIRICCFGPANETRLSSNNIVVSSLVIGYE